MKKLLLSAVMGSLLLVSSGMASAGDDDRWDRKHQDRREWRDHGRYDRGWNDSDGRHYRKHRHLHHHHYYHPGRGHYKPWKHQYHGSRYGRSWNRYDDGVTIIFKGRFD